MRPGRATILGFAVANPPGFSDHPALRFDEVTAVIAIGSGVIEGLYSNDPEIRVEFAQGRSNFLVLQENIRASTDRDKAGEEQMPEPEESEHKAYPSLQINEWVVEGATAVVINDELAEPMKLTIDRLQFRDLRGSPEQIAREALSQFVAQVLAATAANMVETKARQMLEEHGDELKDKLFELLNQ